MDYEVHVTEIENLTESKEIEFRVCTECRKRVLPLVLDEVDNVIYYTSFPMGQKVCCNDHITWDLVFEQNNLFLPNRKN